MESLTSHRARGALREANRSEHGFSLIEAVVASFIVVLVFAGFGRGLGVAYLGSKDNAAAQEATAIGVEQLEFARSLDFDQIAMSGIDDQAPLIDPLGKTLLGADVGLDHDENLVIEPGIGVISPTETESVDGVTYSVWRYVSDAPQGLRRVLVLIEWGEREQVMSHRTSTLISEAATR